MAVGTSLSCDRRYCLLSHISFRFLKRHSKLLLAFVKKKTFYSKVYDVVKKIPKGKVLTYKQVASLAGSPKAFRAVGSAMRKNPDMKNIPCHRVVGSDGKMHGYSAGQGIPTKIKLLKKEGVKFIGNKCLLNNR